MKRFHVNCGLVGWMVAAVLFGGCGDDESPTTVGGAGSGGGLTDAAASDSDATRTGDGSTVDSSFPIDAAAPSTCTSITYTRDQSIPLGVCTFTGESCSADSACGGAAQNFCNRAVCGESPETFCFSDADCGSGACEQDITFTFDKGYLCGQFVNGDWWVEADATGTVTIESITPTHTSGCESADSSCRNGWGVDIEPGQNPHSGRTSAYDTPSLPLPHTFSGVDTFLSVLKSIDGGEEPPEATQKVSILHSALLTIVPNGQQPPPNAFRPAYGGPTKQATLYTTDDIQLARMPRLQLAGLQDPSSMPSWEEAARYFRGPFIGINDRNSSITGAINLDQACLGHPFCEAASHYHAHRSRTTNRELLRLTFEDADFVGDATHRAALFGAIQSGIDKSWTMKNWSGSSRIKDMTVPMMFAAFLLDDATLTDVGEFDDMSEVDTFYDSPRYDAGHPADFMWGYTCSESTYWSRSSSTGDATDKWCGDPYGYGEGTLADYGGAYHWCCSMESWKGGALFVHLMQMESVFDVTGFLHVSDRYFNGWTNGESFAGGLWTAPDPCASQSEGGAPFDSNPDCHLTHSCECAPGGGRAIALHDTNPGGGWGETFGSEMWSSFRPCADESFQGSPAAAFPCAGMAPAP